MYDELVKRLHRYTVNCVAYKLDADFADAVQQAADAIDELQKAVYFHKFNSELWEDKYNSLADEKWIPVAERLPSDFVSVQAHMTDAGNFPPVREAYVVNKNWFFPALKEFHPVDMWRRFDEPPKEE